MACASWCRRSSARASASSSTSSSAPTSSAPRTSALGMAVYSPIFNVMDRAARKAARGLVRDFGEVENLQVSIKGPSDFVSTADLQAERTLKQELQRARPEYGFLMEESGEQ